MIYWYEFVLIYFTSGLLLVALHKLYSVLPPNTRIGYALLSTTLISLIMAWWFILKKFEWLPAAQKDQILYATLINFPLGELLFGTLLGWKIFE